MDAYPSAKGPGLEIRQPITGRNLEKTGRRRGPRPFYDMQEATIVFVRNRAQDVDRSGVESGVRWTSGA